VIANLRVRQISIALTCGASWHPALAWLSETRTDVFKASLVSSLPLAFRRKCPGILSAADFARDLETKLSASSSRSDDEAFCQAVAIKIKELSQATARDPKPSHGSGLDAAGTSLWNVSVRAKRELDENSSAALARTFMLARVFAFELLAAGHFPSSKEPGSLTRLAKLAIRTGRLCLGEHGEHWHKRSQ
jgi:hypothetical protein